jgi:hypothetical protein
MSEAKFTKGEWQVSASGLSVNCSGWRVARAYSGSNIPYVQETKANAHLIAVAPEMYNLLQDIVDLRLDDECAININAIKQLLAKARGE